MSILVLWLARSGRYSYHTSLRLRHQMFALFLRMSGPRSHPWRSLEPSYKIPVRTGWVTILLAASVLIKTVASGESQTIAPGDPRVDPSPPALPATFIRGEDGRSTIRAVRVGEPLTMDGRLDEAVYTTIRPASSSLNTIETNARFRWEYEPGSDLFVVYTDGRDTTDRRLAQLVNRGIAIKFSRLFRF